MINRIKVRYTRSLTLVSVAAISIGQLYKATLAFDVLPTVPSTSFFNTMPCNTDEFNIPEPNILQTRILSTLNV